MIRDEHSFVSRAMKAYENIQCIALDEFKEDLNRIITIRKCIIRYQNGEELNIRLVLNQFVILFNLFGKTTLDLVKYKMAKDHMPIANAFMNYLDMLPMTEPFEVDGVIAKRLEEI